MLLTSVTLLVVLYLLHKVRRIHLMTFAVMDELRLISTKQFLNLLRQVQALDGLYRDLNFRHSLPPTGGWAAAPDFLATIANYVAIERPYVIVECGSGTSTVVLAQCVQLNGHGHVYSLEHDEAFAAETNGHLARHGLGNWATVIHAPLITTRIGTTDWQWYATDKLPSETFDMVIVDGPPAEVQPLARYPAGPILFRRLSRGGTIFIDDAKRQDEGEVVRRWQNELPDLQAREHSCQKGCISLHLPTRS